MTLDLADPYFQWLQSLLDARKGDVRGLVAQLRSDDPMDKRVRGALANWIESPPPLPKKKTRVPEFPLHKVPFLRIYYALLVDGAPDEPRRWPKRAPKDALAKLRVETGLSEGLLRDVLEGKGAYTEAKMRAGGIPTLVPPRKTGR